MIGLTNASGKLQAAYAYDSWGNALLTATDSVGSKNKFRFTGEALDPGTGLYYLRTRYYDASIGRFVSRDPILHNIGYPLAANKYGYTVANPVRYADPSGLGLSNAVSSGAQSYELGQQALTQYQSQLDCARSSSCTLNDTDVNNTSQQQVQALKDLQTAGSELGKSAYNGTNTVGPGSAGTAYDLAVAALSGLVSLAKQVVEDVAAAGVKLLIPEAQAASTPGGVPTEAKQGK